MRIYQEENLLNEEFRAMVINEINGPENISRKKEAKKRYEVYKDLSKKYVLDRFQKEFNPEDYESLNAIKSRIANVSFTRSVIDKKGKVYKGGVERRVVNLDGTLNEEDSVRSSLIYKKLMANSNYSKTNKFSELQKNCAMQVMPYKNPHTGKWRYKMFPLNPFLYDVIEDAQNPEMPRVYIFSYFSDHSQNQLSSTESQASKHMGRTSGDLFIRGDNQQQIIADSREDVKPYYIWWSTKYHFTTNEKGQIINLNPEIENDNLNPISLLPMHDFSIDKDGQYWALGGSDLVDADILINVILTDLYYIARFQGFGYFYAFGKDISETLKIGPRQGIIGNLEKGDPTPIVGFASPNSPLDQHMQMAEQHLSLVLSTNGLEPGSIKGTMSATNAQSGIQEIVQKSENLADIEEQQQIYKDGEPIIFDIIRKWHNYFLDNGILDDDLAAIGRFQEDTFMQVVFKQPEIVLTEQQKLDVIEKRRALGLDTMIDSLKRDNPELDDNEAKEKLVKLMEEKIERNRSMIMGALSENNLSNEPTPSRTDRESEEKSEG